VCGRVSSSLPNPTIAPPTNSQPPSFQVQPHHQRHQIACSCWPNLDFADNLPAYPPFRCTTGQLWQGPAAPSCELLTPSLFLPPVRDTNKKKSSCRRVGVFTIATLGW